MCVCVHESHVTLSLQARWSGAEYSHHLVALGPSAEARQLRREEGMKAEARPVSGAHLRTNL